MTEVQKLNSKNFGVWKYTSNAIDNNSKAVQTLKWVQLQAQLLFYRNYRIGENVCENVTFHAKCKMKIYFTAHFSIRLIFNSSF